MLPGEDRERPVAALGHDERRVGGALEVACAPATRTTASVRPASSKMEQLEGQRIVEALEACGGNQTRAAETLGISRRTLVNRLDAFGLPRPRK